MSNKTFTLGFILSLVLFFQTIVSAAPAPSGFLNATWGDSIELVTASMEANGYKKTGQGPDYLSFTGLFAGEMVEIRTEFINNSMYFGSMLFLSSRSFDSLVIRDKYETTKKMLVEKYGSPNKTTKTRWLYEANWQTVTNGTRIDRVSIFLRGENPWYYKAEDRNRRGSIVIYYTNESLKTRLLNKSRTFL
ncbi:MAG: hypothetical protein H6Q73_116 [Firmicutes bacterium]|nr:hypothetical protein [Bacillota bacterium]